MEERARWLFGERLWRWLAMFALDAAGVLLGARAWAGLWLATIFTVWWDPLGRSREPIPLRGRCRYAAFRVAAAPTEYERRALACFYRWHDSPDEGDWAAALSHFGLGAPPGHILQLEGAPAPAALQVKNITLSTASARGVRTLRAALGRAEGATEISGPAPAEIATEVSGPTPIGGLAPESFIRDLDRAAERGRGA